MINLNPPADTSIYILGSCKLQNQLMAAFMEEKTGAKCMLVERFQDILVSEHKKDEAQARLALLDCLGKDYETCLSELESLMEWSSARGLLGLLNISRGCGIEEAALMLGAKGFFYQEDSPEKLIKGVRAMLDGEIWLSRKIMSRCIQNGIGIGSRKKPAILSSRERQILALVALGATNAEVADSLCISAHTVKTHIYKIFKKIKVPNRLQAAFWAAKNL